MDSTIPTLVREISDPVFRIWSKLLELIIEENQPQTSIYPISVHNKIWASSRSRNSEPDILLKKTEPILGKGAKLIQPQVFNNDDDDDMAAYWVVSIIIMPWIEVDKLDKECLINISQIISTVRKILKGTDSSNKVLNKFLMMDLEMDITAFYLSHAHNLNFNHGKVCMQNPSSVN